MANYQFLVYTSLAYLVLSAILGRTTTITVTIVTIILVFLGAALSDMLCDRSSGNK